MPMLLVKNVFLVSDCCCHIHFCVKANAHLNETCQAEAKFRANLFICLMSEWAFPLIY